MKPASHFDSDYLVIGGGIAGLMFALAASEVGTVTVLTKAASSEANTAYAQGGIASVWSVRDSFESHVDDTLNAGAGLCDRIAVETIVREGPAAVRELIRLGTQFSRIEAGGEDEYDLGHDAGHRRRRQGLPIHHQSRYRVGRRRGDGVSGGRADREHGVHPVSSDLS